MRIATVAFALAACVALQPAHSAVDPLTGEPLPAISAHVAAETAWQPPQLVGYAGDEAAGTVIVDTAARALYLVLEGHQAIRYSVGVARPGFEWNGVLTVSQKREWPDWRPPAEMLEREPHLPDHVPGGPDNPLGARALYLGSTLYRIHGSNDPRTIGLPVSSGCIRMLNEDVMDLYERVDVGATVIVL